MTTTQNTTSSRDGQPGRIPTRNKRYASQMDASPAKANSAPSTFSRTERRRSVLRHEPAMVSVWGTGRRSTSKG